MPSKLRYNAFTASCPCQIFLLLIGTTVIWGMAQVLDQGLRAGCHRPAGVFSNLLGATPLFAVGIPAVLVSGSTEWQGACSA